MLCLTWKQLGYLRYTTQSLNWPRLRCIKGNVIDTFEEFIDPGHPLSETTINLTGITDEMVRGSKPEKEVMELFEKFLRRSDFSRP